MVNVKPAPNKINLVHENFIWFILINSLMLRILSYLPDPCAVPITKRTAWCGSRTLHWVKYPYVAVIARDLSQDKLKGIIFDIRGESISPFKKKRKKTIKSNQIKSNQINNHTNIWWILNVDDINNLLSIVWAIYFKWIPLKNFKT